MFVIVYWHVFIHRGPKLFNSYHNLDISEVFFSCCEKRFGLESNTTNRIGDTCGSFWEELWGFRQIIT